MVKYSRKKATRDYSIFLNTKFTLSDPERNQEPRIFSNLCLLKWSSNSEKSFQKKKKKSRTQTIPKTPVFLKKETTLKKIPKFKNFQILTLPKAKILPEIRFKFKLNRDRNKHATSCRESKLAARVFESNNYRFDRDRNRTPRSTQLVRIKTRSDRDTFAISN